VIISLDIVSALHTGIYGYEEPTTPRLDQFARDALVFERAYTPSSHTLPAHASLMTGLYPETHGVIEMSDSLPPQATTLAERLQEKGYRTAAFERPRASELDPEIVRGLRAIGYAEE
jgi:arylsulfatase A-like enzyme